MRGDQSGYFVVIRCVECGEAITRTQSTVTERVPSAVMPMPVGEYHAWCWNDLREAKRQAPDAS